MTVPICIIHPSDPVGSKVGGIETFIKGIMKHAPQDFDIEFVGITSDKVNRPLRKLTKLCEGAKKYLFFPLCYIKNENQKNFIPLSLRFSLASRLSGYDPANKILIFHRSESAFAFVDVTCPKIGFVHNDIKQLLNKRKSEALWRFFPSMYMLMEKYVVKSLDVIYFVNMATLAIYGEYYPLERKKFVFLPTWVDNATFFTVNTERKVLKQTIAPRVRGLSDRTRWILFAGRLQEQKAPLRLIESFYLYHKKNPLSSLIIIGDGNLKEETKAYVERFSIFEKVHFLEPMRQPNLADFYRASDLFLLTSNFEGMPMAVLEALGCGIPVVSTDVGEVRRVVKDGYSGEVVTDFSPATIADAIHKVLNNPGPYRKENCEECVKEYIPQKVLTPVYDSIRSLSYRLRDDKALL